MTGWVLFVITLFVAIALGLALKRRTDDQLASLEEKARGEVADVKSQARGRVDRLEREAGKAKNDARDGLLRDIIPVFDALMLAYEQTTDESVRDGLQLVIADFEKTLKRHGVEAVAPSPGEAFDPTVHEAVETMETNDVDAGSVGRLHRQGWRTEDRVLRAALVGVAKPIEIPAEAEVDA